MSFGPTLPDTNLGGSSFWLSIPTCRASPTDWETFAYDGLNRATSVTHPDSNTGTAARLFRQSFEKQFGPLQDKRGELSTALAMQESTLGTRAPYNPLQLSCSSGTCPRPRDVEFNVDKALDELTWRVQKYDLFKALARYNQAADPEGHAEKVLGYYEGIKATETGSEFSPEYPTAPLPQELR